MNTFWVLIFFGGVKSAYSRVFRRFFFVCFFIFFWVLKPALRFFGFGYVWFLSCFFFFFGGGEVKSFLGLYFFLV